MHIRYHCSRFKFDIMSFDHGFQIGIRFNNWARRFPFIIPLDKATLLFSLRQQGLFQSLCRGFRVPLETRK